jgi:hypothetical protein
VNDSFLMRSGKRICERAGDMDNLLPRQTTPGNALLQRLPLILSAVLGIALSANSGSNEGAALRLVLSEVQPGTLTSQHYCLLVFDDHLSTLKKRIA